MSVDFIIFYGRKIKIIIHKEFHPQNGVKDMKK